MNPVKYYILHELSEGKKSLWKLLENNRFLLKDFLDALNILYEGGFISTDEKGIFLTEKAKKELNLRPYEFRASVCQECHGKGFLLGGNFEEILREFKRIVENRPQPLLEYFQGYMDEFDVVARVAFMHACGDISGKDFILIGDDDLLSVALALTELPSLICVLDIDERLGEFIKHVNNKYGFEIDFKKYDVAEPLPEKFVEKFDVFSSEPLETLSGLTAFVVRGVSCLKSNGVGYFGLTTSEASLSKWLKIQRIITKMNCAITDIIQGFSRYPMKYATINYENFAKQLKFEVGENLGTKWYKSALFRFQALGQPKPLISWKNKLRIKSVDPKEDITHPSTIC
jgi:hypothetical protein